MKILKKIFRIPTGDTKEVEAAELWEVRWMSRYGMYKTDVQDEIEVFFSEDDANAFADSLRKAFKLLRYSLGAGVSVKVKKR